MIMIALVKSVINQDRYRYDEQEDKRYYHGSYHRIDIVYPCAASEESDQNYDYYSVYYHYQRVYQRVFSVEICFYTLFRVDTIRYKRYDRIKQSCSQEAYQRVRSALDAAGFLLKE